MRPALPSSDEPRSLSVSFGRGVLASLVVAALSTTSVQAQTTRPADVTPSVSTARVETPPSRVDPEKRALLNRYFQAIAFDQTMSTMMDSMLRALIGDRPVPERDRVMFQDAFRSTSAVVLPEIVEAFTALFAEAFTTEELRGLVAFYEGPIGRSLTAKTAVIAEQNQALFAHFLPRFETELVSQLEVRSHDRTEPETTEPSVPMIQGY